MNIGEVLAHGTPAYYFPIGTNWWGYPFPQRAPPDLPDLGPWMQNIPDNTLLKTISIPGTHDTMARVGLELATCQVLSLEQQLRAGIRALDIRCRCRNDQFENHHGPIQQGTTFYDVLNTIVVFLNANPSETILMRLKEEYGPENCEGEFEDQFDRIYFNNGAYSDYWWTGTDPNVTLGQIRKKIVMLYDEFPIKTQIGFNFRTFSNKQDLSNVRDLGAKWDAIKTQLINANDNRRSGNFYVNFLSGNCNDNALDITLNIIGTGCMELPFFVASGHISYETDAARKDSTREIHPDFPKNTDRGIYIPFLTDVEGEFLYEGMNVMTYNYIQQNQPCFCGIVFIDYPGAGLIDEIQLRNFRTTGDGC